MTELSAKLAQQMREVQQAYRREPVYRDPQSPNRRAAKNMEQTLRLLETSSRQLAARVKDGGGYEETLGVARKIGSLLNDADVRISRISGVPHVR